MKRGERNQVIDTGPWITWQDMESWKENLAGARSVKQHTLWQKRMQNLTFSSISCCSVDYIQ